MKNKLMGLIKDEQGQGMTEYGLIIGLIAVALVAGLGIFKDNIAAVFTKAGGELAKTTTP
jgi:pilus assembly protein Flp/PilA